MDNTTNNNEINQQAPDTGHDASSQQSRTPPRAGEGG